MAKPVDIAKTTTDLAELLMLDFRPGVLLCLFNRLGEVLVAERRDRPEWQLPQGGIKEREDIATAALRELREELGTNQARILASCHGTLHRHFPDWAECFRQLCKLNGPKLPATNIRYCGEKHFVVALLYEGSDKDIDLSGRYDPEQDQHGGGEFQHYRWVPLADIVNLAAAYRRPIYKQVVQSFRHLPPQIVQGHAVAPPSSRLRRHSRWHDHA